MHNCLDTKKGRNQTIFSGCFVQEYKPPSSKDIPVEFNVSFLKKASTPKGVLGAKGKFPW